MVPCARAGALQPSSASFEALKSTLNCRGLGVELTRFCGMVAFEAGKKGLAHGVVVGITDCGVHFGNEDVATAVRELCGLTIELFRASRPLSSSDSASFGLCSSCAFVTARRKCSFPSVVANGLRRWPLG